MKWYDFIGWIGTLLVLAAYASGSLYLFAIANATLCIPVALPAIFRKAYNGALISLTFGTIGLIQLVRN